MDAKAIRAFEPFINAIAQGGPGSGGIAWFRGEARDHFEVARRHGRIRYTVLSMGRIASWYDDLLGWVIPVAQDARPDAELLEVLGACRVMPGYEIEPERRGEQERVALIAAYLADGSERDLFSATAVGAGGVRFWFGSGNREAEQPWRRLVLDSVRLARVEGQTEDLGQVIAEQLRVHHMFGPGFEIEVERFASWQEAEARACILGARQEDSRRPWDMSHLERARPS